MRELQDELEIRWLIEKWVLWRDGGDWERFASVWSPGARMVATWFDGPASEFIERSRAGWLAGVNVAHTLGGTVVDVAGSRGVAQTKMTISQRLTLHDQLVDVVCHGRFYDLIEKSDLGWRLNQRRCVYDTDRVIAVEPGQPIAFDPQRLQRFPEGYRHLAYAQELAGMTVNADLPGRTGTALQALYESGRAWLAC